MKYVKVNIIGTKKMANPLTHFIKMDTKSKNKKPWTTEDNYNYIKNSGCKNCGKKPVEYLESDPSSGNPVFMCKDCIKNYR